MGTDRCLTVHQPYAALLCLGLKQYETRTRRTNVRGTVIIHAAKTMPIARGEIRRYGRWQMLRDDDGLLLVGEGLPMAALRLPTGAFIGSAYLYDSIPITVEDLAAGRWTREEIALGDFTPGRWLWHMRSPMTRPPIPGPGKLGFFRADLRALEHAQDAPKGRQ